MDENRRVSMLLDYIFGKEVSKTISGLKVDLKFSKKTGRLKNIMISDKLFATMRVDGGLALTLEGGQILNRSPEFRQNTVKITEDASKYIALGKSVFAKHIVECGSRIKPGSEVVVLDSNNHVLAVGKAILSSKMMIDFSSGVAVKIRNSIEPGVHLEEKA